LLSISALHILRSCRAEISRTHSERALLKLSHVFLLRCKRYPLAICGQPVRVKLAILDRSEARVYDGRPV